MTWWTRAFGPLYAEVYHHRDDASASAEISGLLPRLRAQGGPVLDAGCGGGRHLDALRSAGIPAIGLDLSPELLAIAAARAGCRGRLARGDLRWPPVAPHSCGAVLLLFTAFGYFDDAGNAECLGALADLLAPGGWLVLDLPDPERLRRTLVPESRRTTPRGLVVHERRSLSGQRVEKTVRVEDDGREVAAWSESVRLYDDAGIAALAAGCGFTVDERWPGLHGPQRDEGRLVHWLRRPVA